MKKMRVAVVSAQEGLMESLASTCPEYHFGGPDAEGALVSVVTPDAYDSLTTPSQHRCRIIVTNGGLRPGMRRPGDLYADAEAFRRDPRNFLEIAQELTDARESAARLSKELQFLEHIHELTTMGGAELVSERITRTVLDILKLPFGTLLLHDPKMERYVVSFSNDPQHRDTGDFVPGIPPSLLQRALKSESRYAFAETEIGTLLIMPIEIEEDMIAVLKFPISGELDEELCGRAAHYLGLVTAVLGNFYQLTRSRDLAMRDDLTRAYNRRFFESHLDEEIERARRYGAVLSVIFLDLDDLKLVNNLYGHLAGSRTLQEVAKRILLAVRGIDKVVRFGGDEFCIILPQTDQGQARAVANRVLRAIADSPLEIEPGISVSITASFGIATYPQHGNTKEELIRRADAAMYSVKSTTKNAIGIPETSDVK
jgi:diguanylate cyclase (GGDEF)-like protein